MVRVYLNNLSNGKIEISCLKPLVGHEPHSRPYDSTIDAKNVLFALGIRDNEVDSYLTALRGREPMNPVEPGEYSISDETLATTGFTAV